MREIESGGTKSEIIGTEINKKEKLYSSCKDNAYVHDYNKINDINNDTTIDKNINTIDNSSVERSVSLSSNNYNTDINTTNANNIAVQNLNSNIEKCKNKDNSSSEIFTPLNNKKVKNKSKPKKKEIINEINVVDENEEIINFSEGAPPIGKDEKVLCEFSF